MSISVIRGRYLADILDQPRALQASWNALRRSTAFSAIRQLLAAEKFDRLVLTGMGSSFFGLHPLMLETAEHGWTPILLETSELIHYYPRLLNPSTLVVAVSQSGQSAETVRLLQQHERGHSVIGITNTPESPLAKESSIALLTDAGSEFTVSCKTYISGLLAASALGAALCGKDVEQRLAGLESASAAVASYLEDWNLHVEELAESLRSTRQLFLVGRGASMAAVGTGALTIKESDHFHAEGMSAAAFRHGPFEMLSKDTTVCVFAGDDRTRELNLRMAGEIRATRAQALVVATDASQAACRIPDVGIYGRPIMEILPVQMITLALAALDDREAGKFDRATKITAVE